LKCIYSMMPIIQINFVLYKMEARKDGVGREQESRRERERKRETDRESEGWSIGDNCKWRGLRNDHWKRHPEYLKSLDK